MKKIAKLIRVITTAPFFAAILCTLLYLLVPNAFSSTVHFVLALVYLTVLPLLAYPVAAIVPALRKKGRDAERNLAIVFSLVGYLGGFLTGVLGGGSPLECVLFGTYLLSGVSLAACTALHFKASGHSCGCSGPIAMLSAFVSMWFLLGYVLLTPIIWSSRKLGRHTPMQLLVGALIPVASMAICSLIFLPR